MSLINFSASIVALCLCYGIYYSSKSALIVTWILNIISLAVMSFVLISCYTQPGFREIFLEGEDNDMDGVGVKFILFIIFLVIIIIKGHYTLAGMFIMNIVLANQLNKVNRDG